MMRSATKLCDTAAMNAKTYPKVNTGAVSVIATALFRIALINSISMHAP